MDSLGAPVLAEAQRRAGERTLRKRSGSDTGVFFLTQAGGCVGVAVCIPDTFITWFPACVYA